MKKSLAEYMDDDDEESESEESDDSDKDKEKKKKGGDIGEMHAMHLFEKAIGGFGGDSTMVERFEAFKKLLVACKE